MKFLKFLECINDVFTFRKFLRFLAECLLGFKILLEIQVPEVPVYLDFIVELLDVELVCVIQIPEVLYGNLADGTPSRLKFTECRKCRSEIILFFYQCFQVIDDSLLLLQVLFPLGFQFPVIFSTFFLIPIIYGFKTILESCKRIGNDGRLLYFHRRLLSLFFSGTFFFRCRNLRHIKSGGRFLSGEFLVESGLYSFRFL